MSNLLEGLLQQIGPESVGQIAQQLGVDEGTAQQGIQTALPVLLSALARNAQSPEGAEALAGALTRDHDGSVLDSLPDTVANFQNGSGAAILGHVLGGQRETIGDVVGQSLGGAGGGALLQMLAPVVMGYLGRQQRQSGLDPGALAGLLGQNQQGMTRQSGDLLGLVGQLLDGNHDGSPLDDLLGMAQNFLGRR